MFKDGLVTNTGRHKVVYDFWNTPLVLEDVFRVEDGKGGAVGEVGYSVFIYSVIYIIALKLDFLEFDNY